MDYFFLIFKITRTPQGKGVDMDFKEIGKILAFGSAVALGFSMVACDDSSSASGSEKEESKGNANGSVEFPDISGEGCNFKKEDKVWGYTVNTKIQGIESKTAQYFIYNENGSKDSIVDVSTGKEVDMACSYIKGRQMDENSSGEDSKTRTYTECKDGAMYISTVTEYEFETRSRDDAFEDVMENCKNLNNYDKENVQDLIDSAMQLIDSTKQTLTQSCDFEKTDDEWVVTSVDGDMIISWKSGKGVATSKETKETAEDCQNSADLYNAGGEELASCDGKVFITVDNDTYSNMTRDDAYQFVKEEICAN